MKNLNSGAWPQSWKQPSGKDHQSAEAVLPNDYLYDLYAVCNHHGGMHGGHYTGNKQDSVIKFFFVKNSHSLYWNFCSAFYVHVPLAFKSTNSPEERKINAMHYAQRQYI